MALPALKQKLLEGFRRLVIDLGEVIIIRNSLVKVSEREREWNVSNESFEEFSVKALPITGGDAAVYSRQFGASGVGAGMMEWAFERGDFNVSKQSLVIVDCFTHKVESVVGRLFVGKVPLIQHVMISL